MHYIGSSKAGIRYAVSIHMYIEYVFNTYIVDIYFCDTFVDIVDIYICDSGRRLWNCEQSTASTLYGHYHYDLELHKVKTLVPLLVYSFVLPVFSPICLVYRNDIRQHQF